MGLILLLSSVALGGKQPTHKNYLLESDAEAKKKKVATARPPAVKKTPEEKIPPQVLPGATFTLKEYSRENEKVVERTLSFDSTSCMATPADFKASEPAQLALQFSHQGEVEDEQLILYVKGYSKYAKSYVLWQPSNKAAKPDPKGAKKEAKKKAEMFTIMYSKKSSGVSYNMNREGDPEWITVGRIDNVKVSDGHLTGTISFTKLKGSSTYGDKPGLLDIKGAFNCKFLDIEERRKLLNAK